MKTGLLLLNLGTPDDPHPPAVKRYLREFLSDPYVIDIPAPLRWMLLNLVILPTRPLKSSEAYRKVWTERGSPLLFHLEDLVAGVRKHLPTWAVEGAMRYGRPSVEEGLRRLRDAGATDYRVFPLYPQYSLAATESSLAATQAAAARLGLPAPRVLGDFYEAPEFVRAFAEVGRAALAGFAYDHALFSFHGLPERHVRKTDPTGAHCLASPGCCDRITEANRRCYRAQCFATERALARALGIPEGRHSVSFQSRLGRTPWIQPHTDAVFRELVQKGVRRLAVFCPAFVADCLETLEEIQIRGREDFIRLGGEELRLVPSLNASPVWVQGVAELAGRL